MDPLIPQENKEAPQDPQDKKIEPPAQSGAGHIDMGSILLPKKEVPGHTPDSAQRINAGALLDQELTAGALGTDTAQAKVEEKAAEAKPALAPATPVAEETLVKPLETFQRDIESVVQHDNVSVLTIATAEAERRSATGEEEPETKKEKTRSFLWNALMVTGGLIFLVAASGALAYLVTRSTSVPLAVTVNPSTPFISVDAAKEITVTADESRQNIMASLDAARQATSLSLGLMSQLVVTESSSTDSNAPATVLSAQDFFTLIAPNIPATLARTLQPDYLLGVHVYNGNQAFIIANVYSYEEAYSGMLAWEPFLQQDLAPLFLFSPTPRIPEQGIATTSVDSTQQFTKTGFVDKIVENHDARVLQTQFGDIYLLWTFLDRNTLVITTNDATLREIISRLKEAPITPIPGQ
jgi:hypothetical protein